jgi:hypothetical protein
VQDIDRLKPAEFVADMTEVGVKSGDLAQRVEQMIRSKGDLLVLPTLAVFGVRASIAWVRHVWQAPMRAIAFRTSEARTSGGQRVARLDSPYRYRLTQLMAQVFSDIGLPDHEVDLANQLQSLFS